MAAAPFAGQASVSHSDFPVKKDTEPEALVVGTEVKLIGVNRNLADWGRIGIIVKIGVGKSPSGNDYYEVKLRWSEELRKVEQTSLMVLSSGVKGPLINIQSGGLSMQCTNLSNVTVHVVFRYIRLEYGMSSSVLASMHDSTLHEIKPRNSCPRAGLTAIDRTPSEDKRSQISWSSKSGHRSGYEGYCYHLQEVRVFVDSLTPEECWLAPHGQDGAFLRFDPKMEAGTPCLADELEGPGVPEFYTASLNSFLCKMESNLPTLDDMREVACEFRRSWVADEAKERLKALVGRVCEARLADMELSLPTWEALQKEVNMVYVDTGLRDLITSKAKERLQTLIGRVCEPRLAEIEEKFRDENLTWNELIELNGKLRSSPFVPLRAKMRFDVVFHAVRPTKDDIVKIIPKSGAEGIILTDYKDHDPYTIALRVGCGKCSSTGKERGGAPCVSCNGTGKTHEQLVGWFNELQIEPLHSIRETVLTRQRKSMEEWLSLLNLHTCIPELKGRNVETLGQLQKLVSSSDDDSQNTYDEVVDTAGLHLSQVLVLEALINDHGNKEVFHIKDMITNEAGFNTNDAIRIFLLFLQRKLNTIADIKRFGDNRERLLEFGVEAKLSAKETRQLQRGIFKWYNENSQLVKQFALDADADCQVFLSLRFGGDKDQRANAHLLKEELAKQSVRCFLCAAGPGESFGDQIRKALFSCCVLVAFATDNYGEDSGTKFTTYYELDYAFQYKRRIVPLRMSSHWPPNKNGDAGRALTAHVFSPGIVYMDCQKGFDAKKVAEKVADML